jgi:hypothetical protein
MPTTLLSPTTKDRDAQVSLIHVLSSNPTDEGISRKASSCSDRKEIYLALLSILRQSPLKG